MRSIALALLLSGCVTEQWTKPGASEASLSADLAQCQYETDRARQSCMKAKGWNRN